MRESHQMRMRDSMLSSCAYPWTTAGAWPGCVTTRVWTASHTLATDRPLLRSWKPLCCGSQTCTTIIPPRVWVCKWLCVCLCVCQWATKQLYWCRHWHTEHKRSRNKREQKWLQSVSQSVSQSITESASQSVNNKFANVQHNEQNKTNDEGTAVSEWLSWPCSCTQTCKLDFISKPFGLSFKVKFPIRSYQMTW